MRAQSVTHCDARFGIERDAEQRADPVEVRLSGSHRPESILYAS